jgi:hypothetical protein
VTARRRTIEAAAEQRRVIAALLASGDTHVAARLQRCMSAMTTRRQGAGWPWMCRGSGGGCVWCRQALGRRWWRGLRHWIMEGGEPVSRALLPVPRGTGDLRVAVARLRRACRDVRDRMARRRASWRRVSLAGMATGDVALLLVRHPGIGRSEVADVLEARWPDAFVGDVGAAEPSWTMATGDAVELARIRRGVEPLRIVVPPQRAAAAGALHRAAALEASEPLAPMPFLF